MTTDVHLVLGLILIALSLAAAVVRPFGLTEAVVAVPAALIAWLAGLTDEHAARRELGAMAPTVCFLAAILVFGHLCATAGVFDYLAGLVARASSASGRRFLVLVVALAAGVTATLTLDATVVLVTPVVLATAHRLRVPARPHVYACGHVANSGSLLLPVSNLTNLLVFAASGLSFGRFAAAMTLPWLVACGLDWLTLRIAFRHDLEQSAGTAPPLPPTPRYGLTVLAFTVLGFVITTALDVAPAWAALAGCLALGLPLLVRRRVAARHLVDASSPGFIVFVLALAVLVNATLGSGLDSAIRHVIPSGHGLLALIGLTFLAAALANVVNNLPATLALVPFVSSSPLAVLALLVGVNVGPNATFAGSLATLLWRRTLPAEEAPGVLEFHRIGLIATPVLLLACTCALWLTAPLVRLR